MAFIDTEQRPAGEVQQKVGRIKLSEAIKAGLQSHEEVHGGWCGCAIGLAHRALHNGENLNDKYAHYSRGSQGIARAWAREHGFDPLVVAQAESQHNMGISARDVADWLAAQGL